MSIEGVLDVLSECQKRLAKLLKELADSFSGFLNSTLRRIKGKPYKKSYYKFRKPAKNWYTRTNTYNLYKSKQVIQRNRPCQRRSYRSKGRKG